MPGTCLTPTCERALTALKYFCEQAPEYFIAAAGSLLGVAIIVEGLHIKTLESYRLYLIIGGMPAVILTKNFGQTDKIQAITYDTFCM
ncbi:MAG: hypothetical protein PHC86_08200 [Eubacteriales bacterium]|nr:hypothetical protein [Eubacteriales bacterium]